MLKRIAILFVCLVAHATGGYTQETSPLLRPCIVDSMTNAAYNLDSVMRDTNGYSPSINRPFIKRGYRLDFFEAGKLNVPLAPADSVVEVSWTAIDTAFPDVRAGFERIYDSIGPFVLRKMHPDDTFDYTFEFRFFSYTPADTVSRCLALIPHLHYSGPEPLVPLGIPNDQGMSVGIPLTSIETGTSDVSLYGNPAYHKLGWQWDLYKIKCPMAWEITMGLGEGNGIRNPIYLLDNEVGWGGTYVSHHPDMTPNFRTIDQAHSDGIPTSQLIENHGSSSMSNAIAAANNGYGMVGSSPKCNGIAIPNDYDNLVDINGHGNGVKTPQVIFDVGGNSVLGNGADMAIKAGSVFVNAGGNDMGEWAIHYTYPAASLPTFFPAGAAGPFGGLVASDSPDPSDAVRSPNLE